MRGSTLFHITLGTIVVLIAGAAGQVANLERRTTSNRCEGRYRAECGRGAKGLAVAPTRWREPYADAPARLIVKMKSGVGFGLAERILAQLMPTPARPSVPEVFEALGGMGVLGFSSRAAAQSALGVLRTDSRVQFAELDAPWTLDQVVTAPSAAPNDTRYAEQWGLENTGQAVNGHQAGTPHVDIDAPTAWSHGRGSDAVVVAVIDSGVDVAHEDLAANIWTNEGEIPGNGIDDDGNGVIDDVHGFNAIDQSGDPDDEIGHGTHVAGIIGAEGDNDRGVAGVNWTTRIMPLKFLGLTGGGTTSDAIACIDYMLKMKSRGVNVRVANCSWGSTERSEALGDAINQAVAAGVVFVCAAGNSGVNADTHPHYPSSYETDGVISVAALAPNESLAGFSNYGAESVDIAAPGVDILSTLPDGSYGFASGTSMAAPFVAGVVALVAADEPRMPVTAIRERVLGSAVSVSDFASKLLTSGRVSGSAALGSARAPARASRR